MLRLPLIRKYSLTVPQRFTWPCQRRESGTARGREAPFSTSKGPEGAWSTSYSLRSYSFNVDGTEVLDPTTSKRPEYFSG